MRIVIALLLLGLGSIAIEAQAPQSPDALARALQKRYDGIRDFSADFVQTYRGKVLRTETREQGTVAIKKPGLMRWVYVKPERKEFVSDGRKIYSYIPDDRQVIVADVPAQDAATTPAMFLAGKGEIVRDFTSVFEKSSEPGTVALKLTPRTPQPEYEWLVVGMDPATHMLRGLLWTDTQGGTNTIVFDRLKENVQPPDSLFEFKVPSGVQIVGDVSAR